MPAPDRWFDAARKRVARAAVWKPAVPVRLSAVAAAEL